MNDLFGTAFAALGGGTLGALIKLCAGFIALKARDRVEERRERVSLAGRTYEAAKDLRENPGSDFVSWTRRVLAWMFGLTFCSVVLLWAYYPDVIIYTAHSGGAHRSILWGLLEWQTSNYAKPVSSGSIVWEMIPFISMILGLYFTPNVAK